MTYSQTSSKAKWKAKAYHLRCHFRFRYLYFIFIFKYLKDLINATFERTNLDLLFVQRLGQTDQWFIMCSRSPIIKLKLLVYEIKMQNWKQF